LQARAKHPRASNALAEVAWRTPEDWGRSWTKQKAEKKKIGKKVQPFFGGNERCEAAGAQPV